MASAPRRWQAPIKKGLSTNESLGKTIAMKRPALASVSGETLQFMRCLWTLAHALDVASKRMARTLGVTGPQRLVLRMLGQAGSVTPGELAATLQMHPSTLTGVLQRLASQQLIERVADPNDRRRTRLSLSARGRRIDRARKGTVEAAVRRAMTKVDDRTVKTTAAMVGVLTAELSREF